MRDVVINKLLLNVHGSKKTENKHSLLPIELTTFKGCCNEASLSISSSEEWLRCQEIKLF